MQTDIRDTVYTALLIVLVLIPTGLVLVVAHRAFEVALGAYVAVALVLIFAATYGGFTALLLAILSVWLPLHEGDYSTDHSQFTLWKVQHIVAELGKLALSIFFPVFARQIFYAIFGASIGRHVAVAGKIIDPRLTELGDRCVLGEGSIVTSHALVSDRFILRRVYVGKNATVGVGSILMPGVRIGAGAVLMPGSTVKAGTDVPAGETWGGIPAVRIKSAVD